MTVTIDEPSAVEGSALLGPGANDIDAPSGSELPPDGAGSNAEEAEQPLARLAAASGLASLAAAWPAAHLFRDLPLAIALCALGGAIGIGCSYGGARTRRVWLTYLTIPAAVMAGVLVVSPFARGGIDVVQLVREAVGQGGLAEAPVALLPGWRFLLVLGFAAVSGTALSLSIARNRPKFAVLAAAPMTLGAMLLQPQGGELLASAVAAALLITAQTVAGGAELATRGITDRRFEFRRLRRGAVMLTVTIISLSVVSQTSFLFPDTKTDNVIPPRKPPTPPPLPDRELFRTDSPDELVWRVGVLDGYGDNALLLPPFDAERLRRVGSDGDIIDGPTVDVPRRVVHVTVGQLPGQTLPVPAQAIRISDVDGVEVDPRTQVVTLLNSRVVPGSSYAVTVLRAPNTKELEAAPPAPRELAREFTALPPAPPGVEQLLAKAPAAPAFDRLQYVRQALYSRVVAAGSGQPTDVAPADVDAMLIGGQATPYEIVAAEVMLTRWARLPARMGFGFNGGSPLPNRGGRSYRPADGSAWLEVYFSGRGWVPLLGVPPRAKASLSLKPKKNDLRVVTSNNLALTVYVPVRESSLRLSYELVRYYVLVALPILLGLTVLYLSIPWLAKLRRRRKRKRWAAERGPAAALLVAYSGFRDRMHDLNVGWSHASALEFLADVEPDEEHEELAWLYTRGLYGDLTRDLRPEDARMAEEMATSVARRITLAETPSNRAIAWLSRASLRDPFTREIPNSWPLPRELRNAKASRRMLIPRVVRRGNGAVAGSAPALLMLMVLLGSLTSCASTLAGADTPALQLPSPPQSVGSYRLTPEAAADQKFRLAGGDSIVSDGQVFSVHNGATVQGSVQINVIKPGFRSQDERLQEQVAEGLALGTFSVTHFGVLRLRTTESFGLKAWLWFPANRNVMELFVMRSEFRDAERVVRTIIASQLGWDPPLSVAPPVPRATP